LLFHYKNGYANQPHSSVILLLYLVIKTYIVLSRSSCMDFFYQGLIFLIFASCLSCYCHVFPNNTHISLRNNHICTVYNFSPIRNGVICSFHTTTMFLPLFVTKELRISDTLTEPRSFVFLSQSYVHMIVIVHFVTVRKA
jgi:hypothetical protein